VCTRGLPPSGGALLSNLWLYRQQRLAAWLITRRREQFAVALLRHRDWPWQEDAVASLARRRGTTATRSSAVGALMSRRHGRAVQIEKRAESVGDGEKVILGDSHRRCHDVAGVHTYYCHDAVGAYACPDQPREWNAQTAGASQQSRATSDTVLACGHHQRQLRASST